MIDYVNAFSMETNTQRTDIIIHVGQAFPKGEEDHPDLEPVADYLMPAPLAREFAEKIQLILSEDKQSNDE